jgi:SHS2 domain-containing protein
MFTFFDHTADLGIRIEAATLNDLFADAGRALMAALIDDPATVRPAAPEHITVAGNDAEYLLFDWLRELLLRFETRKMLYCGFQVAVNDSGLSATVSGEPLNPARHPLGHEVKAITYHGLSVQKVQDNWVAEVIVDI